MKTGALYGLIAEFTEPQQVLNATREAAKLVKGACQQVSAVSMRFHL